MRRKQRTSCQGMISGYLFKLVRESIPRSQEALADDLGVDPATVQGWESGRRPLAAVAFRQMLTINRTLLRLGANTELVAMLVDAAEADSLVSEMFEINPARQPLAEHPLAGQVMTNKVTQMLAWLLRNHMPVDVAAQRISVRRRGPVPKGPNFGVGEVKEFFEHLRVIAERARRGENAALLHRQVCFLGSMDDTRTSTEWLKSAKLPTFDSWSPMWPEARSLATSRARQGDLEPLRAFIARAYNDDACKAAELNYWAYWVGEMSSPQRDDSFMINPKFQWAGERLLKHLVDRLNPGHSLVELNIHAISILLTIKPHLPRSGIVSPQTLTSRLERLLDERTLTGSARHCADGVRRTLLR